MKTKNNETKELSKEEKFREEYILKCASIVKYGVYCERINVFGNYFVLRAYDYDELKFFRESASDLAFKSIIKVGHWDVSSFSYQQELKLYNAVLRIPALAYGLAQTQFSIQKVYFALINSIYSFIVTTNSKFLWSWWRNTSNHPKLLCDFLVFWSYYNNRRDEDKVFESFKFIAGGFSKEALKIKTTISHEDYFFKSLFKGDREKSIRQLEEEGEAWNRGEIKDEHDAVIKGYENAIEEHRKKMVAAADNLKKDQFEQKIKLDMRF